MEETIVKAVAGTTGTVSYEVQFDDATKKTFTVGSYRTQDISGNLAANIKAFNNAEATSGSDKETFINSLASSNGGNAQRISACTVTVKTINVLIG